MACGYPVPLKKPFTPATPAGVLMVPCGKCAGCLLARARNMSLRAMHELPYHAQSAMVTLTYDQDNLPTNDGVWPSLQPMDVQLFLKRLRKNLGPKWPKLKIIYCGEYGDKRARPHYHLIIFGVDFRDKHVFTKKDGRKRKKFFNVVGVSTSPNPTHYTSTFLQFLWPYGNHDIGPVTPETVSYVCRYTLKKQANKSKLSDTQYPEFVRYSNRGGGIGFNFIADPRNLATLIERDTFVVHGQKYHPPRYYSEYLKSVNPDAHETLVANRITKMNKQELKNLTSIKIINRDRGNRSDSSRVL